MKKEYDDMALTVRAMRNIDQQVICKFGGFCNDRVRVFDPDCKRCLEDSLDER